MSDAHGEWWLVEGQAHFADGDVGDINHLGFLFDTLASELAEALVAHEEFSDLGLLLRSGCEAEHGLDPPMLRQEILDWSDQAARRTGRDELYEDPYTVLREAIDWDETRWDILTDDGDNNDGRLWAIEHRGWVRLADNRLECWKITKSVLKMISDALWDVYEDDSYRQKFTIEERSSNTLYKDVPYATIADAAPSKLREHLTATLV